MRLRPLGDFGIRPWQYNQGDLTDTEKREYKVSIIRSINQNLLRYQPFQIFNHAVSYMYMSSLLHQTPIYRSFKSSDNDMPITTKKLYKEGWRARVSRGKITFVDMTIYSHKKKKNVLLLQRFNTKAGVDPEHRHILHTKRTTDVSTKKESNPVGPYSTATRFPYTKELRTIQGK